jgi:predicted GIY-YIG superfamily endonuclease
MIEITGLTRIKVKDTKFVVYMWTNSVSGKSYIGYTGDGIAFRWGKHLLRSRSGGNTHFDRALRKYPLDSWSCRILYETDSREEALKYESCFINEYKTVTPNGYNSSEGGTGGNTWFGPNAERRRALIAAKNRGNGNPNFSGISDDQILSAAVTLWLEDKNWIQSKWYSFCHQNGFPLHLAKSRFSEYGGGFKGLKQAMIVELNKLGFEVSKIKYTPTREHRQRVSAKRSRLIWATNTITVAHHLIPLEEFDAVTMIRGRKNVAN